MADDTPDLVGTLQKIFGGAVSDAPGALQAASEGGQRALDMQRQSNQSGLDFLKNYDNGRANLPMLALAAGLGGATKTGSIGESMSNGFSGMGTAIRSDRQAEMDRFSKIQAIQQASANLEKLQGEQRLQNMQRSLELMGGLNAGQGAVANAQWTQTAQGLVPQAKGPALSHAMAGSPVGAASAPPAPVPGAGSPPPPPASFAAPSSRPDAPPYPAIHGAETTTPPEMNTPPVPMPSASAPSDTTAPGPVAQAPMSAPPQPSSSGNIPTALADTLDNAMRIVQAARGNPGSSQAQAAATAAQALLKEASQGGKFAYDPRTRSLVPVGEADLGYIANKNYSESSGKKVGENQNTSVTVYDRDGNPKDMRQDLYIQSLSPNGQGGAGPSGGAGVTTKESPFTKADVTNYEKFTETADKFRASAPQVESQLKALANIYSDYASGRSTEAKANLASWAKDMGLPLSKGWDSTTGGFDAAMKTAQNMAFQRMVDGGVTRAPAAELKSLASTVPGPLNDPAANYKIITEQIAATRYTKKMYDDFADNVRDGGTRNVNVFQRDWAKKPENQFGEFLKGAKSEIAPFKGMPKDNAIKELQPKPGAGAGQQTGAASIPAAGDREVNKVYTTPNGNFRWMGNGWLPVGK